MNSRNLTLLAFGIALICAFEFSLTSGYAAPLARPEPPIERQGQRGHWRYRASVDHTEGRVNADVSYAVDTVAQVDEFTKTQRQLGEDLVAANTPTIDTTIVFRHPLTQAQFEQFVAANNLGVTSYTLRFIDNQGQRVTISGAPDAGVLVPGDLLNLALADVQQRSPGTFRGWVEVQAWVPNTTYKSVADDKNVYLVDVSRAAVRAAFKDDAQAQNLPVDVIAPQLFWKLEDLKLATQ